MMRFLALGATLFFATAASALTIEPLPGSAPQSTRATAFFRNPVGVLVRDDRGVPIPGVRVYFSQIGGGGVYVSLPDFSFDSVTNSHGVAVSQAIASLNPGVVQITAEVITATGSVTRVFAPLTIVPTGAEALQLVSGSGQIGRIGIPLNPWKVRAVDGSGRGVPYAAVTFFGGLDEDDGESGLVTFDGRLLATVMADSAGYATSPVPMPKLVGWVEGGDACLAANFFACTRIEFSVTDWTVPKFAAVIGAPLGVELGKPATAPFVVKVIDNLGRAAVGVPVRFNTPAPSDIPEAVEACGAFGGAYDVTVLTDNTGIATSPLFTGVAPGMCVVAALVGGLTYWIRSDVLVYTPDPASIDAPLTIVTITGRPFKVKLAFKAGTDPIYGLPVDVEVVPAANGAAARFIRRPSAPFDSNEVTLEFNANSAVGLYHLAVTRGPIRSWIAVDQRGR